MSIYIISFANVGLDQNLSVSVNSYLYDYFEAMESFLNVGVPVYFVLEGPFPYQNEDARSLVCGSAGCDLFGLSEQISRASKQPENSTIETPAASWIDDYLDWLRVERGLSKNTLVAYQRDLVSFIQHLDDQVGFQYALSRCTRMKPSKQPFKVCCMQRS